MSYLVKASIHFNRFPQLNSSFFILSELLFPFPAPARWHLWAPVEIFFFSPARHVVFKWQSPYSRRKWKESRRHPEASIAISPPFHYAQGPMENKIKQGAPCA